MRDNNRIAPFLHKLNLIWNKYPDMRFGQLVECLFVGNKNVTDLFNIEDEVFEKSLDNWIEELPKTYKIPVKGHEHDVIPYYGLQDTSYNFNPNFVFKIETTDGSLREVSTNSFYCTGVAPSLDDVKLGKVSRSELGTIGYFRYPSGHLCEAGRIDFYLK